MKPNYCFIQIFLLVLFFTMSNSCKKNEEESIVKTNPSITWNAPATISEDSALGASQLNAKADVPGTFVYNPAAGTILNTGTTHSLRVDFKPKDTINYNSTSKLIQINSVMDAEAATATLIFSDEFNGTTLNRTKWRDQLWDNTRTSEKELQYYSTSAFTFANGALGIKAEKKAMGGRNYTSGVITTLNSFKFTYGIVKARLKMPAGRGFWPAFWLLDYAGGAEEIDIMEFLGHQTHVSYMTLHFPHADGSSGSENIGTYYNAPTTDFTAGYHTFKVDWNASRIIWYIDGIERYRATQHIPTKAMYLIINLAVGGDWPGPPDVHTKFPSYYNIDYIRVYKQQ